MINVIWQIYLWFLIIIAFLCGVAMVVLMHHRKYSIGNREATDKWLDVFQKFFWSFIILMAVIGVALAIWTIW